jgi:hypothetical protein
MAEIAGCRRIQFQQTGRNGADLFLQCLSGQKQRRTASGAAARATAAHSVGCNIGVAHPHPHRFGTHTQPAGHRLGKRRLIPLPRPMSPTDASTETDCATFAQAASWPEPAIPAAL